MKTKEPPYTEPYVRWCGRTVNKIIIYLLPDSALCSACYEWMKVPNSSSNGMDIVKDKDMVSCMTANLKEDGGVFWV